MAEALETAEEQGAAHDVEVLAQRVEQGHAAVGGIDLEVVVIGAGRERVVEDFVETGAGELFADEAAQVVGGVGVGLVGQRRVDGLRHLDFVVAVDAQDVLYDVAGTDDVHAVGGDKQVAADGAAVDGDFVHDFDFEAFENFVDGPVGDMLAKQAVHVLRLKFDGEGLDLLGVVVDGPADDFTSGKLLDHQGGELEGVHAAVGVDTALKAERGVGAEAVAACRAAYAGGVEAGTLEEDRGGLLGDARAKAAEDSGDTHLLLGVADHQVGGVELALHLVEGDEFGILGGRAHHDFVTGNLIAVEAVQGLTHGHEYVVGDVDNIVDGAQTDGGEAVAEPFGALFDGHALDGASAVADTALLVKDLDVHALGFGTVDTVALHGRACQHRGLVGVDGHPGGQVAGHAVVAGSIDAVWGEVHLEDIVAGEVEIFGGGSAGGGSLGGVDDDDAVMAGADANLVLGADHAVGGHAAHLGLLDGELLVAVIEGRAHGGDNHRLSGGHVGGAADNLLDGAAAEVDGGDMQMVAVGMSLTGEHLAHHQAAEAAADNVDGLYTVALQSFRRQGRGELLRRHVEINVVFKPLV